MLTKGDVVTHSFRGGEGGILDAKGRVLGEVRAAVERGVHLDVGHGAGSFSFDTAEKALEQELLPGTISSDLHQYNVNGPVVRPGHDSFEIPPLGIDARSGDRARRLQPGQLVRISKGVGDLTRGRRGRCGGF